MPLPDADAARTRAWAVLADAHASRVPAKRARRRGRVIALAFAAVLAGAAVAVAADSPRWVRSVLGTAQSPHPVRVSLGSLPAGRLLVSSSRGTWIVRGDGTRVRLGPWTAATWSPRGLYVAAWRGRELSAVAPDGRVAWTLAAPAAVRDARWSPDGYRIAYRRASGLAVVAGDGTGPRILAAAVRPVAPAWRPGEPHTLAWVGARGRVEVRDVDTGRVDWRSAAPVGAVRELLWSADGRRLLVRGERRLVVFEVGASEAARSGRGRATARNGHTLDLPRGARVTAAAWAPRGRRLAIALRTGTTSRVVLTGSARIPARPTFAAPGALTALAWSPDGSRLLVRWREPDQWLLLPAHGATGRRAARAIAIAAVSRRFGGAPRLEGWLSAR
jgi:dipeptidyl aminopeptidase/acylaminoacyl peptidase